MTSRGRTLLVAFLLTANFLVCTLAAANQQLSGTWYDPSRPGDGFDFHIVSTSTGKPSVVIFYYGYDLDGAPLWLVSDTLTPANANDFQNLTMFRANGHGFQGSGDFSLASWGSLDFKSTGCGTGRFTLTPSGQQPKVINASQLIDVPGPGCLLSSPRAFETIGGLSGSWFVSEEPGDGFNIWTANTGLVLFFYGYDQYGDHLWLVSNPYFGPLLPGKEIEVEVVTGTGGSFYDVRPATLKKWGKVRILWKDCDSAEARLEGLDGTRLMNLSRLIRNPGTLCKGPGTIELSEPTITFEESGDMRPIQFEVRDYADTVSSPALVEVNVEDEAAAEIVSARDGTAVIRARVDTITSTKVTFWDPVTNSTQELPISIVDLQPDVFRIPYDWVQRWQTPLSGQVTEIHLASNSATRALTAGMIIASEGGLVGKVESVAEQSDTVVVQASFVALPDVFWNLDFGVTLSASAVESSSADAASQQGLEQTGHRKFAISKPRTEAFDLSCKFDSGVVINNALELFAEPPTFQVGLASTKLDPAIAIRSGKTIREQSRVFFETLLLGEVSLKFAPGAVNPQYGIKCTLDKWEFVAKWATLQTGIGTFTPKFSLSPGVDFFLESVPEGQLIFDLGLRLRWGIDFKDGVKSSTTGGLEAGDFITLRDVQRATPGSSAEIKPLLKGKLGISWGSPVPIFDLVTFGLVDASISFPFSSLWTPPFDSASPNYRGPYFSISVAASGKVQAAIDSTLFELLRISPLNIFPGVELFSWEKILSESPRVSITPVGCGSNCDVGDTRKFSLDILKDGFYRNRISGDAYLMAFNSGSTIIGPARYQAGNSSLTDQLEMWPTTPGQWTVVPRFLSTEDGLLYGGDPVVITVSGQTVTYELTVNKTGSGTITSSPTGIDCGATCSAAFSQGTVITLTATPADGWAFSGWSGACSGDALTCSFTLADNSTVNTIFSETGSARTDRLATGASFTCAMTDSGQVKCWGWGLDGQLGNGNWSQELAPVDVVGLSAGISAIAAGGSHACALDSIGGVACWGKNNHLQLGIPYSLKTWSPQEVPDLPSGVASLSLGEAHSCALTREGGVKCWGHHAYTLLGDPYLFQDQDSPVSVPYLESGVIAIAAGNQHTCALRNSGAVWCWGRNLGGALGNGSSSDSEPGPVIGLPSDVKGISAGGDHSCAVRTSGGVMCWGANTFGELGDGTTTHRSTPVHVLGLDAAVKTIATGGSHTCGLTELGGVRCWGSNTSGQLGDGTTISRSTPVAVTGLNSGVLDISLGNRHSCALMSTGGIKCWGSNSGGQLGDGTESSQALTPTDVIGFP